MLLMRCLIRRAVSGRFVQIGCSALSKSATVIAFTGLLPNAGNMFLSREASHCALCLALRNVALRLAWTSIAAALKVGTVI